MPRLPAPEDYERSAPQSTRQVVSIRPSPVGEAIARVGYDLTQMAEEETKKLDALAADNALTKLEDERMRRTFDPKDGFTRVQGTAILDKNNPILKTVPETFNKSIEAIASTLTPQQQQLFRARASRVSNSLRGDLYRHVAVQTEKAYDESDNAKLKQAASVVSVDPSRLDSKIGEVSEVLSNRFSRNGETDAAIQNVARTEAVLPLINAAMKAHTTGDNPNFEAARQIMKTYDDIIPEAAKKALNEEIVKEERNGIATALSSDMFAAYAAGDLGKVTSGAILAEYGAKDEKLRIAAKRLFDDRVNDLENEREQGLGGLVLEFGRQPSQKLKDQLMRSDAFKALDSKRQAAFDRAADDEIWQRHQRNYTLQEQGRLRADRAEEKAGTSQEAMLEYINLYTSPDLARMSDETIAGKIATLGKTNTMSLLVAKKQQLAQGSSFDFDKAQVTEAVAGLGKEDKPLATAAIYRNLTAWKERNPARAPTAPEQDILIRNALVEVPTTKSFFGMEWSVVGRPAYKRGMEKGDTLTTVYRGTEAPIPVPKDFVDAANAHAAKSGRRLTQQDIADAWAVKQRRDKGTK